MNTRPFFVTLSVDVSDYKDEAAIYITTKDGSPLTAQILMDALGDYLLLNNSVFGSDIQHSHTIITKKFKFTN